MAVFHPKRPTSMIRAISLTIGAAIRKLKVTPRGTPASTKPKNKGMAEHEQKGVKTPKSAAIILPMKVDLPARACLVFSGEK